MFGDSLHILGVIRLQVRVVTCELFHIDVDLDLVLLLLFHELLPLLIEHIENLKTVLCRFGLP